MTFINPTKDRVFVRLLFFVNVHYNSFESNGTTRKTRNKPNTRNTRSTRNTRNTQGMSCGLREFFFAVRTRAHSTRLGFQVQD